MPTDYSSMFGRNSLISESLLLRKFEDRLADLLPLIQNGFRILEIGCAEGSLCSHLKNHRSIHFSGVEPSLDRLVAQKVLDATYKDINELGAQSFDVILSFHTLEHLVEPDRELSSWASLLSLNGKLIVEVPNGAGHPDISIDTNVEHLHFFKPSSIVSLLEKAGFEPLRLTTGHFESPLYTDSIRVVCGKSATDEERRERLLHRLKSIPSPIAIFGLGGDFYKFIAPNIGEFPNVEFIDLNPNIRHYYGLKIVPKSYSYLDHRDHNFLISTFKFESDVRQSLLKMGHNPLKIFALSDLLWP
jgi:SAM-dependent methyltransferase